MSGALDNNTLSFHAMDSLLFVVATLMQGAPASKSSGQAASAPMLGDPVKAALITAAVTVIAILLKDWFVTNWHNRRKEQFEAEALFQRYGDPLGSASVSLLFRLDELLEQPHRGTYLRGEMPPTSFAEYKRISTAHRLATLLGWVRAVRREQSFLPAPELRKAKRIQDALAAFEAALADGYHVEMWRLERIADLWHLTLPPENPARRNLAVRLEQIREQHTQSAEGLSQASDQVHTILCKAVRDLLCPALHAQLISDAVLQETKARVAEILTSHEAWIYRDWQVAIGDMMLQPVTGGARRFDVLGFGEFEDMWSNGKPECKKWLRRLDALLLDLDITLEQSTDARVAQMSQIRRASAELVLALAEARRSAIFTNRALEVARGVTGSPAKRSRVHRMRAYLAQKIAPAA